MGILKLIFTFFFFISSCFLFSQTLSWQWAHGTGLTGEDMAESIAADDSGNVYACGSFTSATITFGGYTLTNAGSGTADLVVVKYNPSGTVIWAKSFGDVDGDIAHGISLDAGGNIYLTGWFTSPMVTMGSSVLVNSGSGTADIFVAKLNPVGNTLWAKSAGGSGADVGYSIAADAAGNTYVTGMFMSASANFGTNVLNNAGGNAADIFIARYDASGTVSWAKSAGGTGTDISYSAAVDANGNGYFTGWFASSSLSFGTNTVTCSGGNDLFAAKYDAAGNSLWAKSAGASGNESGNFIATDSGGNVFIAGSFESAAFSFASNTLNNQGGADCLLLKYDASGNPDWARSAGELYDEVGTGVVVSSNGEIYMAGKYLSQNISFGTSTLTNANAGAFDLFVARYDAAGNASWAIGAGGSFQDIPNSICMDTAGTIYIAGKFDSPNIVFGPSTLYKGCGNDFFVAVLGNSSVDVQEYSGYESFHVFPNPSSGGIFFISEMGEVEVIDSNGKIIEAVVSSGSIDVSNLPKGIYFLRSRGSGEMLRAKIMVK